MTTRIAEALTPELWLSGNQLRMKLNLSKVDCSGTTLRKTLVSLEREGKALSRIASTQGIKQFVYRARPTSALGCIPLLAQ